MYVLFFTICVGSVAIILFRNFGHALKIRTDKGIAGFFYPRELLRKDERTFLSLICLIPLTTVFYTFLYYVKQFEEQILEFFLQNYGYPSSRGNFCEHQMVRRECTGCAPARVGYAVLGAFP